MSGPVIPNQAQLNGLNPLAYMGVRPTSPTLLLVETRNPTINDKNYALGTFWMNNNSPYDIFFLANLNQGVATWIPISTSSGGPVSELTSNSGGAVPPLLGNINVVGDGITITGVGNPATNTITFSTIGSGTVDSLTGNSGGAVSPLAGNINVVGDGTTVNVVGNPGTHTLTISAVGLGVVETITGNSGGAVSPSGGNINIVGDIANNITIVDNPGTHTLTAAVTGTTNHSLLIGNASGSISSLGVATNGQLPIGSTGANPVLSTLTAGTGISITNGAGSITITNTGTNPASSCSFFAYNNADVNNFFTSGIFVKIQFPATLFNVGANYNTGTYIFTAPNTGMYCFQIAVAIYGLADSTTNEYSLQLATTGGNYLLSNGSPYAERDSVTANSFGCNQTQYVSMTAGDTAQVQYLINNAGGTANANLSGQGGTLGAQYRTIFSGYQVA